MGILKILKHLEGYDIVLVSEDRSLLFAFNMSLTLNVYFVDDEGTTAIECLTLDACDKGNRYAAIEAAENYYTTFDQEEH